MLTVAESSIWIVVSDESCPDLGNFILDLLVRARSVKNLVLEVHILGSSVLKVIPALRDTLLSNLSVAIRLYIEKDLSELVQNLSKTLQQCSNCVIYVKTTVPEVVSRVKELAEKFSIPEVKVC